MNILVTVQAILVSILKRLSTMEIWWVWSAQQMPGQERTHLLQHPLVPRLSETSSTGSLALLQTLEMPHRPLHHRYVGIPQSVFSKHANSHSFEVRLDPILTPKICIMSMDSWFALNTLHLWPISFSVPGVCFRVYFLC